MDEVSYNGNNHVPTSSTTASKGACMTALHADKDAFEAFGILYYPLFKTEAELADHANSVIDAEMAFATTCAANMEGTGYALLPGDIMLLAGARHALAGQLGPEEANVETPNPAADIRVLVPSITVDPMYPGFPREVLEIDEAMYRFHQALHYASTYGIEFVSALAGMPVTVARGWMPHDGDSPGEAATATGECKTLVDAKILKLVLSEERMHAIVTERLAQPTRMHEAEIRCAVKVLAAPGQDELVAIAFHANMLGLVQEAAEGDQEQLRRMLTRIVQHPGDVLKAITFVRTNRPNGKTHLSNRQKRAFCAVLETFTEQQLTSNIVEAHPENRRSVNYLSVARFGGPKLKRAVQAVESGQVKSWNAQVEEQWGKLNRKNPDALLALYRQRPGMLLRALTRLTKSGIPADKIRETVFQLSDSYSLATVVRTLTIASARGGLSVRIDEHPHELGQARQAREMRQRAALPTLAPLLHEILEKRLAMKQTPLRGKRVFVNAGDFSIGGSVVMPNDVGNTGTAYPPAGMAYHIPRDATVRFFTFWDDRDERVDVDLHFFGTNTQGNRIHVGWNSDFRTCGMVTSGDITHSVNAVEYLDIDMAAARGSDIDHVIQKCHIYSGAPNWGDIDTCFSGAMVVESPVEGTPRSVNPKVYQAENVIFRDDMTGMGRRMNYALIDVPYGYVRILRGANYPFTRTSFTLGAYIMMLLASQEATLVNTREEADVVLSIGRTEEEGAICLIDENFFLA